jgi:hypothetical protein
MEHQITPSGEALKPLWVCFTDAPGEIAEGKFNGTVVHSSASPTSSGFIDGYSSLGIDTERDSGVADIDITTSMRQAQSNISIYSSIKDGPFLGFSCRLSASFFSSNTIGAMTLRNINDDSLAPYILTFGHNLFKFQGPQAKDLDVLSIATFESAIVKINEDNRYLTSKFDLHFTSLRTSGKVVSPRATYRNKVFITSGSETFLIYDEEFNVNWNDRYTTSFTISTRA